MDAIQMERLLFWDMMTPEQQDYARRFTTLRTFEKGMVLQTPYLIQYNTCRQCPAILSERFALTKLIE